MFFLRPSVKGTGVVASDLLKDMARCRYNLDSVVVQRKCVDRSHRGLPRPNAGVDDPWRDEMEIIRLEIDQDLYRSLTEAARSRHSTLEQECLRRLSQNGRRSYYLQALVAELRAEDQQRRAAS